MRKDEIQCTIHHGSEAQQIRIGQGISSEWLMCFQILTQSQTQNRCFLFHFSCFPWLFCICANHTRCRWHFSKKNPVQMNWKWLCTTKFKTFPARVTDKLKYCSSTPYFAITLFLLFCQTECPWNGLPPHKQRPKYGYNMMFADDLLFKGGLLHSGKSMFKN